MHPLLHLLMTQPGLLGEHAQGYAGLLASEVTELQQVGQRRLLWRAATVACRALRFIEEITRHFSEGSVLAVSHKATIRIILSTLLGIDIGSFRYRLACPVGSISVVEFTSQGPLLRALADRSHLSDALQSLPGT